MRRKAALLAPLALCVLAGGSVAPSGGLGLLHHSIRPDAPETPRSASVATLDWCGVGQPLRIDRKPEADASSFRHVHVTYVLPADTPSRFSPLSSAIVTDLSATDAWWQREDPARTVRFDRFAFPGCSSKLGSLDLGFLRLPRPASSYAGEEGLAGMLPELTDLAALSFHKHLVYYDGPPLFDPVVCGTTLVSRRSPDDGGLAGISFIWLRSLCGQDVGTGTLNAEIATHELAHAMGAIGRDGSRNECPSPNQGHVCDSTLDILYPETSLDSTLAARLLDVNRDDYYDHRTTAVPDPRNSPYLTHLPQQKLRLAVQLGDRAGEPWSMTSPVSYNCKDACSLELDLGLSVTLVGPRRRRLTACRLDRRLQRKERLPGHHRRRPNNHGTLSSDYVPPYGHRWRKGPRFELTGRPDLQPALFRHVRCRIENLAPRDPCGRVPVRRLGRPLRRKAALHRNARSQSICGCDVCQTQMSRRSRLALSVSERTIVALQPR